MESAQELIETWNAKVGARFEALPGSQATAVTQAPHGARLSLALARRQTVSSVLANIVPIAKAFERPVEQVWAGSGSCTNIDGRNVATAQLMLTDGELLDRVVPFPRVRPTTSADGRVALGVTLDGLEHPEWKLWDGKQACPGLVVGPDSSGLADLLRVVMIGARALGDTGVMLVETARGTRLPGLTTAMCMPAPRHDLLASLEGMVTICRPHSYVEAGRLHRLIRALGTVVVIQDAHRLFAEAGPEGRNRWLRLLDDCRDARIAVIAVVPDLSVASFGGHWQLRNAFMRHNVAVLGTQSIVEPVAPGLRRPFVATQLHRSGVARMAGQAPWPFRVFDPSVCVDGAQAADSTTAQVLDAAPTAGPDVLTHAE